eukprot:5811837-Prymnesium_polylepis.2
MACTNAACVACRLRSTARPARSGQTCRGPTTGRRCSRLLRAEARSSLASLATRTPESAP